MPKTDGVTAAVSSLRDTLQRAAHAEGKLQESGTSGTSTRTLFAKSKSTSFYAPHNAVYTPLTLHFVHTHAFNTPYSYCYSLSAEEKDSSV